MDGLAETRLKSFDGWRVFGSESPRYPVKSPFLLLVTLLILPVFASASDTTRFINPGDIWPDDRGLHVNAHGGGILKLGDTWYWFGEYRSKVREPGRRAVSCYSSTDLVNWTFRGLPIDMGPPEGRTERWVLERPKVFYNAKTRKFVMWMHVDDVVGEDTSPYAAALIGIAVSDTVDGKYEWVRAFRPFGLESRDIGQFVDDDGTAYVIFESRPSGGFYIAKLTDDHLDVAEQTAFIKAPIEGGALVNHEGSYYLLGSHLTGWDPNPNLYATATDLKGPWSEFKHIAPPETKTYRSQSTMLLKVAGTEQTSVIFMGDQWRKDALWDSRYLWMPLEIGGGKAWLPEPKPWTIDVKTGRVTVKP